MKRDWNREREKRENYNRLNKNAKNATLEEIEQNRYTCIIIIITVAKS